MTEVDCVVFNNDGNPYQEMSCLYPKLSPLYTRFELEYDPIPGRDWMRENPAAPICAVVAYGVLIVWGEYSHMSDRKPYNWRKSMAAWNFLLSLFSLCGFIHTFPHLLHNLSTKPMRDVLCNDPESAFGSGATGFWVQLFVLSKFPELLDTAFIVAHKKPLIFLHWYHHITVLLYCWHSYVSYAPSGLFFVVMNYAVHAIMYGYYFLMAIKQKPKWFNAVYITVAQILQMVGGVIVTCCSFYYYATDRNATNPCWIKRENTLAACVMYGSYLMLFVQFFFQRYQKKGKRETEKKTS